MKNAPPNQKPSTINQGAAILQPGSTPPHAQQARWALGQAGLVRHTAHRERIARSAAKRLRLGQPCCKGLHWSAQARLRPGSVKMPRACNRMGAVAELKQSRLSLKLGAVMQAPPPLTEQGSRRAQPSGRPSRIKRALFGLVLLVIGGSALLGLAVTDRSALPSWVPAPLVEAMPGPSVVRSLIPTSWADAKSRLGLGGSAGAAPVETAELKDYEFQLAKPEIKQGDDAVVAVRLVHKPTGRPVPDAVIFARRLDMAPDGMPTMTSPVEPVPAAAPGTYQFRANLMMVGSWQLSLAAKVQGETGTVQNRLVLKAVP